MYYSSPIDGENVLKKHLKYIWFIHVILLNVYSICLTKLYAFMYNIISVITIKTLTYIFHYA